MNCILFYIANLWKHHWMPSITTILGAFAKLRKATIRFAMTVSLSLSVRMEKFGLANFHEIWYTSIFRKSDGKIQILLKSDQNYAYLHDDQYTFMIISRWILLRMRNVSHKICWENQNTHFYVQEPFFPDNLSVYKLMWKNAVEPRGHKRQHNMAHALCMLDT